MIAEAKQAGKSYIRKRADSNVFWAAEEIDLRLEPGTLTALYGPSGSGKSTLLAMLAGILKPSAGEILYDGTDIYQKSDEALSTFRNETIGVVPQGQTAIQSLTVLENVLLPAGFSGKKGARWSEALRERAKALLTETGIEMLADTMPRELSGGELRRMAIARALILDPAVILADEPTADLDSENTTAVLGMFKKAAGDGRAVLIVTHDPEVLSYADVVLNMKNGRLVTEV